MGEGVRILCVDDERNVLRALERLFMDDDYEILTAGSGEEGLELLGTTDPVQIIISDYRMPGVNGVDFLREACRQWPETVRIVLSGYADTAAVVAAINDGEIYKFIPKPWNDDELRVTIGNAVERYFLHRKNQQLMQELTESNAELQAINENLESLVAERTAELEFQIRLLARSQNILDALPVAVVGLDANGLVVQCNQKGKDLLGAQVGDTIEADHHSLGEVKRLSEEVAAAGEAAGSMTIDGVGIRAKGVFMKHPGQEGIVLVMDNEV
jgi:two-component system NtrC family sensor kinase